MTESEPVSTPEPTAAPNSQPLKSFRLSSTKPVVQSKVNFKLGFSFGFFAFLISPIILFQSVLLFLFLLVIKPTDITDASVIGKFEFLLSLAQLLFFSILLFIVVNFFVSAMGLLFDKRRTWALIALVLTAISLVMVFVAPKLIAWQSDVLNIF